MTNLSKTATATSLVLISILAGGSITGCASAPVLKAETSIKKRSEVYLPEQGVIHRKKTGQSLVSFSISENTYQQAAIMINGFSREATFKSSGYNIEVSRGAKGLLIDDYSACFNNKGLNVGVYNSKGKTNFCFYDKNKDRFFDMAMLDSFNSWGAFPIEPANYSITELEVGVSDTIFKRELVYMGNSTFEYRTYDEKSGAEPASTKTITSDFSGGEGVITVEGAKLKVHSISDNELKYSVISYFGH